MGIADGRCGAIGRRNRPNPRKEQRMHFTKMHGLGNDYVFVNGFHQTVPDPKKLAPQIANRHFGVGGDGLILLLPPSHEGEHDDLRMRMFNADGSEAEMCGNGIRCACKLAHDRGITDVNPMRVLTGAGLMTLRYTLNKQGLVDEVTVDMGEPITEPEQVPVDVNQLEAVDAPHNTYEIPTNKTDEPLIATFVSMGNPHAVLFVRSVDDIDLAHVGPIVENHPAFPNRMNVHFVESHGANEVTMRTWERGSGITQACGTGACAVCVAGVMMDCAQPRILAHLPGGDLTVEWAEKDNHVYMTGPATEVFTGDWPG
jgi:diaminopimelate epimerase